VEDTGLTTDPTGATSEASTGTLSGHTIDGSATVASADGTSSDGPTTMPLDDSGTTDEPPTSSSGSSGAMESSGTTGTQGDCDPLLVEVFYDTANSEDSEQWVKLYNPCDAAIDLGDYSVGWGGVDYTVGTMDLVGFIAANDCFIVGGPMSSNDNDNPMLDQATNFDPDIDKGNDPGNGVALFFGSAASILPATVPVDAVIYGNNNDSNLLDADGNTPAPHVGDAGDNHSIRRTADAPMWIVEARPMPNVCPPY
jgi:hypothetical protein